MACPLAALGLIRSTLRHPLARGNNLDRMRHRHNFQKALWNSGERQSLTPSLGGDDLKWQWLTRSKRSSPVARA
jgi:hypothetical protein